MSITQPQEEEEGSLLREEEIREALIEVLDRCSHRLLFLAAASKLCGELIERPLGELEAELLNSH